MMVHWLFLEHYKKIKDFHKSNSINVKIVYFYENLKFTFFSDFGPLPCSIVTTTRKFFTVLASVLFFGNSLITRQWIGVGLVFAGLFMDGAYGKRKVQ